MRKVNFIYEVGHIFNDKKRNITIIDKEVRNVRKIDSKTKREYLANEKWYKYHCNKCGNEDWIIEGAIKSKEIKGQEVGCNVCCPNPQKTVLGINTIWDKEKWMCNLGVLEEDAKKYTPQSNKTIEVVCPYCGEYKKCKISDIYRNHSIGCICADNISSGEKIIYSILKQLGVEFKYQLSKKDFLWCDKFRYDFYIPNLNIIIETNGEQHYKENTNFKKSLEYIRNNDIEKEKLALKNGIEKYIIIDCKKSDMDYIKNSIYNSDLINILKLYNVDWDECLKFAFEKNLIKIACEYKKHNPNFTTSDIGNIMNFNYNTIRNWLKIGNKLGWCEYIPTKSVNKKRIKKGEGN